jgi:steroid delta-isomerase-like uncharacterized protein
MGLHQNRRLWQKHVLAENRRSVQGLLDTLCDEPVYTIMATGEEYRGKDAVATFYRGLFAGVPDATFDLITAFVGEEGVVEESVLRGTHQGMLFGMPPTGRKFELPLIIVFPMKDGQILGERMYFDLRTLLKQLGLSGG